MATWSGGQLIKMYNVISSMVVQLTIFSFEASCCPLKTTLRIQEDNKWNSSVTCKDTLKRVSLQLRAIMHKWERMMLFQERLHLHLVQFFLVGSYHYFYHTSDPTFVILSASAQYGAITIQSIGRFIGRLNLNKYFLLWRQLFHQYWSIIIIMNKILWS